MRRTVLAPLVLALPLVALPFVAAGPAVADGAANANLTPVVNNGSSGSGTAMVKVTGGTIDFTLAASEPGRRPARRAHPLRCRRPPRVPDGRRRRRRRRPAEHDRGRPGLRPDRRLADPHRRHQRRERPGRRPLRGRHRASTTCAAASPSTRASPPPSSPARPSSSCTASPTRAPRPRCPATSTRRCPRRRPTRPSAACCTAAPAGGAATGVGGAAPSSEHGAARPGWRGARRRRRCRCCRRAPHPGAVSPRTARPVPQPPRRTRRGGCGGPDRGWRLGRRAGLTASAPDRRPAACTSPRLPVPGRRRRRSPSAAARAGAAPGAARSSTTKTLPRSRPVSLTHPVDRRAEPGARRPRHARPTARLEVPVDPAEPGWFSPGAAPGQFGPAVIAGHVDGGGGPAVFYRLGELRPGAAVEVGREDGSTARFVVDKVERYAKDAFPTVAVYGDTHAPRRAAPDHLRRGLRRRDRPLRRQRRRLRPPGLTGPVVIGSSSDCAVRALARVTGRVASWGYSPVTEPAAQATRERPRTMGHYKSNLRDVEFNLFEVLGTDRVLGTGPFGQLDVDSARDVLKEVERLATARPRGQLRRRRPQPAGLRPGHRARSGCRRAS